MKYARKQFYIMKMICNTIICRFSYVDIYTYFVVLVQKLLGLLADYMHIMYLVADTILI